MLPKQKFILLPAYCCFILIFSFIPFARSQEQTEKANTTPIGVELLLSNRGATFQSIVNKSFRSLPRLGFFGVTNFVAEWRTNQLSDYMTQGSLSFQVYKGFNLNAGFHLSNATGVRPSLGLMYSFADKTWLVVINPRVDIFRNANAEGLLLAEYKPQLKPDLQLYSRVQLLYGETIRLGLHARSYFTGRLGVSWKEFTLGAGTSIDYYGPERQNFNSYGVFLAVQLF